MKRKFLGVRQSGWASDYFMEEKPEWLERTVKVTANTKCLTCNQQAKELCSHCRYAYCQDCYTKHTAKEGTKNGTH